MEFFSESGDSSNLDTSLVQDLKDMIDQHNVLALTFRRVRDFLHQQPVSNVHLRLFRHQS